MDNYVARPIKSYLEFSITQCPTERCTDCLGLYSNRILGLRIVCACSCHDNNALLKSGERYNVKRS